MIHSLHRDRKANAIAEVLSMIGDAHRPLAPDGPRHVLETGAEQESDDDHDGESTDRRPSGVDKCRLARSVALPQRYSTKIWRNPCR